MSSACLDLLLIYIIPNVIAALERKAFHRTLGLARQNYVRLTGVPSHGRPWLRLAPGQTRESLVYSPRSYKKKIDINISKKIK